MELIGTSNFDGSPSLRFIPNAPMTNGFLKILCSGELNAQGRDHILLVRINGATSGYQGYVLGSGNANLGEWRSDGFYLGRNGWGLDASFNFEFTLGAYATSQKVVGNGQSAFAHGNNWILGYEAHSFYVTNQPVNSIDVLFTGGVAVGQVKFFFL